MEWQPIETAPRDGTRVMLWAEECCTTAVWGEAMRGLFGWVTGSADDQRACVLATQPTHWMPLPDAPSAPTKGE